MLKIIASYRINNHLRKHIHHIYLHLMVFVPVYLFIKLSHDIKTIKRVLIGLFKFKIK